MEQHRRRLDRVIDPEFADNLDGKSLNEIRDMRHTAVEVENELSYYRRLLYGRMDLLKFELRRRSGEEDRSLIDSLVDILTDPDRSDDSEARGSRHIVTDLPPLPDDGKRDIDFAMGDGVLTRLDDATEDELRESLVGFEDIVGEINAQRQRAQTAIDVLTEAVTERFRVEEQEKQD